MGSKYKPDGLGFPKARQILYGIIDCRREKAFVVPAVKDRYPKVSVPLPPKTLFVEAFPRYSIYIQVTGLCLEEQVFLGE